MPGRVAAVLAYRDASAKAGERFVIWDEAIKGFGLLVLTSGVKSYIFDYRNAQRRKRGAREETGNLRNLAETRCISPPKAEVARSNRVGRASHLIGTGTLAQLNSWSLTLGGFGSDPWGAISGDTCASPCSVCRYRFTDAAIRCSMIPRTGV